MNDIDAAREWGATLSGHIDERGWLVEVAPIAEECRHVVVCQRLPWHYDAGLSKNPVSSLAMWRYARSDDYYPFTEVRVTNEGGFVTDVVALDCNYSDVGDSCIARDLTAPDEGR